MEDGGYPNDTSLGNLSNTTMDFDIMDDLLLEGCWLEASSRSNFLQPDPSTSTALYSPSSFFWPGSEIDYRFSNLNQVEENTQEKETSFVPEDQSSIEIHTENSIEPHFMHPKANVIAKSSHQSEYYLPEEFSESSRRCWIGPGSFSSVRERLFQALQFINKSIGKEEVLIQIWVPVKSRHKQVLTTNDQPYALDPKCQRLASYRSASMQYEFAVEGNSNESVGLPGRVFLQKVPEWTPDVQYFSSDEYPRIRYAHEYDVRGTIAVPIFERGNRSCLGVLEVVMTTRQTNYHSELENVCQALEAVDLRSSEVSVRPNEKPCSESSYQAALPEITEVLKTVCETHKLPLAQTWVRCSQQGKGGCRHSDDNYALCISTIDSACCFTDFLHEFHKACSEHHLFIGEGVAGRAFLTNKPFLSTDITAFSKKQYPLKHYAKMFELRAAVAMRLRSIHDGRVDYVIEFFLPSDCHDSDKQMMMRDSLSIIVQQRCRNLRLITDKELEEENIQRIGGVVPSDRVVNVEEIPKLEPAPSIESTQTSWITSMMEAQQKGKFTEKEGVSDGFKVTSQWIKPKELHNDSKIKSNANSIIGQRSISSVTKSIEKKRTKVEKTISLQVLRQYFAGSLKDAAKSIGVCPTTLKRICRQHGIKRWPSRKIKKVGHSLRKLQVVMDSVQGAGGSFKIGSLYANFPELTSPNLSGPSVFSPSKEQNLLKQLNPVPEGTIRQSADVAFSPRPAASRSPSSSCSQSSNSSLCGSSGQHKHPLVAQFPSSEDGLRSEDLGGVLKRARSDAELQISFQEEPKLLERCHSLKSLTEHPGLANLPLLPENISGEKVALRAKVTFGEEKVRFSMQTTWGINDLRQEISKRFHIDDMSTINLKYLDDDSEWILLTCDADVEECLDVYKSCRTQTIKFSVHHGSQPNLGSSIGSNGMA
ncbi:Nlp2 [Thalictrum thalictroides]|uniref:Nlp2 n=1 Tax=Thalictrum thalictroides TaxID=46969 RepID=A0A7J6V163_THATH|nr:Nlp2 [Thalictrum thalictroides]